MGDASTCLSDDPGQCMGRLERRDDALARREHLKGIEDLSISSLLILSTPHFGQVGMLRANSGIVKSSRDRVGFNDLALIVLDEL